MLTIFEPIPQPVIPAFKFGGKPTLVKTGVKSYFGEDEVLILANRSSNPGKKGLILANSIGVIDSDYYGNPDNDGHIMFAFYNIKDEDTLIKKESSFEIDDKIIYNFNEEVPLKIPDEAYVQSTNKEKVLMLNSEKIYDINLKCNAYEVKEQNGRYF